MFRLVPSPSLDTKGLCDARFLLLDFVGKKFHCDQKRLSRDKVPEVSIPNKILYFVPRRSFSGRATRISPQIDYATEPYYRVCLWWNVRAVRAHLAVAHKLYQIYAVDQGKNMQVGKAASSI